MSDPYVGEIRMFAGTFAPVGWELCAGQLLAISENETLFNLLGTTYGGDGENTFGLPDLRGRIPVHQGAGYPLATSGGVEEVALTVNQTPLHSHPLLASTATGSTPNPGSAVLATNPGSVQLYVEDDPAANLAPQAVGGAGGSQPHSNLQPYLCVNFIISLFGLYPSPS
ncbi:phage tail protein (plasmid) [Deinococcus metallilatus]|uniref:Microcystin-dependent protein n=1 Tax=Deinococcus metallilatus TaxID=1211322 RepID=A0ABR6MNL8_9DEIO|nr:tail fiber protein [Deinococcus metallilatus]MBB5293541.1 microcystin-dependent protein [Deinococcus metallilatus]QBY06616.1 phage tail protein [Deinococcus metallilatus]RXJ17959.1 phage tail protein [Deinococcus metallilatus]GMA15238.1 tail Collar domain-containing protein [Deinococcus metallilatus]